MKAAACPPHHWLIGSAVGERLPAECRNCDATRWYETPREMVSRHYIAEPINNGEHGFSERIAITRMRGA